MARLVEMSPLERYYFRVPAKELEALAPSKKALKRMAKQDRKAKKKNSLRAQRHLTEVVAGRRMIASDPPLVQRLPDLERAKALALAKRFFEDYGATLTGDLRHLLDRYEIVDVARKVVGVGSVGTHCLIVLLESAGNAPLFLQLKEATAAALEPFLKPSEFEQAGHRVVNGQRLTQVGHDIFLGWARWDPEGDKPRDFYIRQLWDGKGSADVDSMGGGRLKRYAELCGRTLAAAHARTGDPAMIAGYLGSDDTFDRAVTEFAAAYAARNASDYAELTSAIADGRITAVKDI
jgi:uncharacterized protein (DUF2252 family)